MWVLVWLFKKCGEKAKLCYVDADSFIEFMKTDDNYSDIAKDVETTFDTSNYELDRQLHKEKKQKSNWINERWIKWKNYEKNCWINSKHM